MAPGRAARVPLLACPMLFLLTDHLPPRGDGLVGLSTARRSRKVSRPPRSTPCLRGLLAWMPACTMSATAPHSTVRWRACHLCLVDGSVPPRRLGNVSDPDPWRRGRQEHSPEEPADDERPGVRAKPCRSLSERTGLPSSRGWVATTLLVV